MVAPKKRLLSPRDMVAHLAKRTQPVDRLNSTNRNHQTRTMILEKVRPQTSSKEVLEQCYLVSPVVPISGFEACVSATKL